MSIHMPEAAGKCKRLNLSDLQFRGHIRAVLHLGERVLAELLMEIEADPTDIPGKLARYAALDADALRVIGGQQFPPLLFAVPDCIRSGRGTRESIMRRSLRPVDGGDAA